MRKQVWSPPTTWDEFYALGDKIREAGYETLTTPYEMGVRSHLPDGLMLRSWDQTGVPGVSPQLDARRAGVVA